MNIRCRLAPVTFRNIPKSIKCRYISTLECRWKHCSWHPKKICFFTGCHLWAWSRSFVWELTKQHQKCGKNGSTKQHSGYFQLLEDFLAYFWERYSFITRLQSRVSGYRSWFQQSFGSYWYSWFSKWLGSKLIIFRCFTFQGRQKFRFSENIVIGCNR
jgi:hypothetical protein